MSAITRCNRCAFGDPDTSFGRTGYGFCRKGPVVIVGQTATYNEVGYLVGSEFVFGWPPVALDGVDGCGEGKERATP